MLEEGFKQANKFKSLPLQVLLDIISEFKENNCRNEWLHKKKKFNTYDLEVVLTCEFTTNCFKLLATVNQISTKKMLVKDYIITTEPDEILYDKMFKDILMNDEHIIITDASDSPRILINYRSIFLGKLQFEVIGDEQVKKILSFKLQN